MKFCAFVMSIAGAMLAPAAHAAEPATKTAAASVPSWDGFYIGAHMGGTALSVHQSDPGGLGAASYWGAAPVLGAQLGFDHRSGNYVVGAQALISASNLRNKTNWAAGGVNDMVTTAIHTTGLLSLRAGYLLQPALLAYGKGGFSFTRFKYGDVDTASPYSGTATRLTWGMMVGAGLEYQLSANWSAFVEYDRAIYAKRSVNLSYDAVMSWAPDFEHKLETVLLGVNYRL